MSVRLGLSLALGLMLIAGCVEPAVTKQIVPLGEVNMTGKECRREPEPGTNIPRTVCADPAVWKNWDDRQKSASDDLYGYTQNQGTFFRRGD